jgi:predicted RNA-binding protein with PUA-like domain
VPLAVLRVEKGLDGMELLRRGSRLSVQPVRPERWSLVLRLAGFDSKPHRVPK